MILLDEINARKKFIWFNNVLNILLHIYANMQRSSVEHIFTFRQPLPLFFS